MESNTNNLTDTTEHQFQFKIGGEKGTYEVSFVIAGEHMKASCTCRHAQPCWHIEYILAGKTSRIIGGDTSRHNELMAFAEQTIEGRYTLRKARKKFAGETHCRRCNSDQIVRLKSSLRARVFTMFKETTNHTYYCKHCKWTW